MTTINLIHYTHTHTHTHKQCHTKTIATQFYDYDDRMIDMYNHYRHIELFDIVYIRDDYGDNM